MVDKLNVYWTLYHFVIGDLDKSRLFRVVKIGMS